MWKGRAVCRWYFHDIRVGPQVHCLGRALKFSSAKLPGIGNSFFFFFFGVYVFFCLQNPRSTLFSRCVGKDFKVENSLRAWLLVLDATLINICYGKFFRLSMWLNPNRQYKLSCRLIRIQCFLSHVVWFILTWDKFECSCTVAWWTGYFREGFCCVTYSGAWKT